MLQHVKIIEQNKGKEKIRAVCFVIKRAITFLVRNSPMYLSRSLSFVLHRVLVLDNGTIAEFDTPASLIASKGIFYSMAKDAGLA